MSGRRLLSAHSVRDGLLIFFGSLIFAVGLDAFQVPNGLAAGGVSGLATVLYAVAGNNGIYLPVGIQTLVMNALLMILVVRSGGLRYASKTIVGILVSGIATDALAPLIPVLGGGDLLLCALWGGAVTGLGLGLVFRSGGNTGGTDIIAQLFARRTGLPLGSVAIVVDLVVIAVSIPVFSLENALYAAVCLFVCGKVIDAVVEGPQSEKAAWIISERHEEIAREVLYEMGRGCTEVSAKGVWSGAPRPMLFVVLGRREVGELKRTVARLDPQAIVVISEVHEAFGEGFKQIDIS